MCILHSLFVLRKYAKRILSYQRIRQKYLIVSGKCAKSFKRTRRWRPFLMVLAWFINWVRLPPSLRIYLINSFLESVAFYLSYSLSALFNLSLSKYFGMHCNENPIYVFLSWELCGLSPNLLIHVSVSDLYIPRIGPHISCSRIDIPILEIYKYLTDIWV